MGFLKRRQLAEKTKLRSMDEEHGKIGYEFVDKNSTKMIQTCNLEGNAHHFGAYEVRYQIIDGIPVGELFFFIFWFMKLDQCHSSRMEFLQLTIFNKDLTLHDIFAM